MDHDDGCRVAIQGVIVACMKLAEHWVEYHENMGINVPHSTYRMVKRAFGNAPTLDECIVETLKEHGYYLDPSRV